MNEGFKVSLNLGGGAARGFAHIGVLRLLQEEKVPFDIIVGVSMGTFIGSIYCTVPEHEFVRDRMYHWLNSREVQESVVVSYSRSLNEATKTVLKKLSAFYTRTGMLGRVLLGPGMITMPDIEAAFFPYIPPINIETLRFPFACPAVSLKSGTSRVFRKGSLRKAVIASAALPMVFPPVDIDNELFCDGGVLDKVGIDAARAMQCRKIIAVDVSNESSSQGMVKNGLDVMFRTEEIASNYRRDKQIKKADLVIFPIKGSVHWADYTLSKELIDMGYESARESLEAIRAVIKVRNPFRRFFTMFRKKMTLNESELN